MIDRDIPRAPYTQAEMNAIGDLQRRAGTVDAERIGRSLNPMEATSSMRRYVDAQRSGFQIARVENPKLGIRQQLMAVISAGNQQFGIVSAQNNRGEHISFLTRFAAEGSSDTRGSFIDVLREHPLEVGRLYQSGLDPTVSRLQFTVGLDGNGNVGVANRSEKNPTVVVTKKAPSEVDPITENAAWAPKSERLVEVFNERMDLSSGLPVRYVGGAALGSEAAVDPFEPPTGTPVNEVLASPPSGVSPSR